MVFIIIYIKCKIIFYKIIKYFHRCTFKTRQINYYRKYMKLSL